jgi:hypothetical protein
MGLPVAARGVVAQPDAAQTAPVAAQQIRRDARLIEEDVAARLSGGLPGAPLPTRLSDVGASLFVGVYRFF